MLSLSQSQQRLDLLLVTNGCFASRMRAQEAIRRGEVEVDGRVVTKPGLRVTPSCEVEVRARTDQFVGRGGYKLLAALTSFGVDPAGQIALDVGASTGGFTQCLLQHKAAKVYALDVGKAQLHESLRADPRVISLEGINIRTVPPGLIPEIAIAVVDVSFISLRLVVPAVIPLLASNGTILALIKPQFEAGKNKIGRRGVIRDQTTLRDTVMSLVTFCSSLSFVPVALCPSPLRGGDGNLEIFMQMMPSMQMMPAPGPNPEQFRAEVERWAEGLSGR